MLCVMYSKAKIDNPPTDKDSEGILQQNLESMRSLIEVHDLLIMLFFSEGKL